MKYIIATCINCRYLNDDGSCEKHAYMKWYGCEEFKPREDES